MAATVYVAESYRSNAVNPPEQSVWLDDTPCYWHLYRYFEAAKVQRTEELVDLYGGAEIDGHELDRLREELVAARVDAHHRPREWKVLTGWTGSPSRESEIWGDVQKSELLSVIAKLISLIDFANENQLKLIVSGD